MKGTVTHMQRQMILQNKKVTRINRAKWLDVVTSKRILSKMPALKSILLFRITSGGVRFNWSQTSGMLLPAQPSRTFISSSTVVLGLILKLSTSTLRTFGETKAGRVGPRTMFFTPRLRRASRTSTAFCSYQAML